MDMTAEIQAGHGRENAQHGGQARRHPAAAIADRARAEVSGPTRVMAGPGQGAGGRRRQVRPGHPREAAARGNVARGPVTHEQGLAQHVGAVGHHPGAGRPAGGGFGKHVVDQIGQRPGGGRPRRHAARGPGPG